jgi:hypothetical protein
MIIGDFERKIEIFSKYDLQFARRDAILWNSKDEVTDAVLEKNDGYEKN